MKTAKDLTAEAPRSPRTRLGGYALMARMIDKGRAALAGTVGDYHYACPLDAMLFGFKEVDAEEVKELLGTGATDDEVVAWFNGHGTPKSADEITAWSDSVEAALPYNNPEKKEWFAGECQRLGLDPAVTTLFGYLEADDADSFKG
ncbi:MAG: DUF5069 domain-containing protein [Verrucomicrobiaceae bacterium]|nr:MAG: DUF5069 domain-containing protein [Verrucomicrobiaceae bacterium]